MSALKQTKIKVDALPQAHRRFSEWAGDHAVIGSNSSAAVVRIPPAELELPETARFITAAKGRDSFMFGRPMLERYLCRRLRDAMLCAYFRGLNLHTVALHKKYCKPLPSDMCDCLRCNLAWGNAAFGIIVHGFRYLPDGDGKSESVAMEVTYLDGLAVQTAVANKKLTQDAVDHAARCMYYAVAEEPMAETVPGTARVTGTRLSCYEQPGSQPDDDVDLAGAISIAVDTMLVGMLRANAARIVPSKMQREVLAADKTGLLKASLLTLEYGVTAPLCALLPLCADEKDGFMMSFTHRLDTLPPDTAALALSTLAHSLAAAADRERRTKQTVFGWDWDGTAKTAGELDPRMHVAFISPSVRMPGGRPLRLVPRRDFMAGGVLREAVALLGGCKVAQGAAAAGGASTAARGTGADSEGKGSRASASASNKGAVVDAAAALLAHTATLGLAPTPASEPEPAGAGGDHAGDDGWMDGDALACASCGHSKNKEGGALLRCAACKRVMYCSRSCQAAHWKAAHKRECAGRKAAT
jgi:hypothetical protein